MNEIQSDKRLLIVGADSEFLLESYKYLNKLFPKAVFVKHVGAALAELVEESPDLIIVYSYLFNRNCELDFSEFFKIAAAKNIHLIAVDSALEISDKISDRLNIRQFIVKDGLPVERGSGFSPLEQIMNTLPFMSFILNKDKQIIFANHKALNLLEKADSYQVIGLRPGEFLDCVHGQDSPGDCCNSDGCSFCGINRAVQEAIQKGIKTSYEAGLTLNTENGLLALNVQAQVNIMNVLGQDVIILYLEDISDLKRRRELERIFFHDITNTAGGIKTMVDYLSEDQDDITQIKSLLHIIGNSSTQLLEEIRGQKDLSAAEHNELQVRFSKLNSDEVIKKVVGMYSFHQVAEGKQIVVSEPVCKVVLSSDEVLINRILGNLLKNALEAGRKGDTVTIGCYLEDDKVVFYVRNKQVIPNSIKHHVFQRSFSTKGNNRGIGTYSIRLLTEKYLKGQVYFSSNEMEGTIFKIVLSLKPEQILEFN